PKIEGFIGAANAKTLTEAGDKPARRALEMATLRTDLDIDFSRLLEEPALQPLATQPPPSEDKPAESPQTALAPVKPAHVEHRAEAIVRAPKCDPWNLQPTGSTGLWHLAQAFFEARCFPNVGNVEQVIAVTVIAQNLGVPMGLAMNQAYFVHGRLAWS